jgi:serine/threonine-protein kinase RsbW
MTGASNTILNFEIVVPNQTRYLRLIGNVAEEIAKEFEACNGDRDTLAYHLNLVLTEAVANAIQYASPSDQKNTVRVCLSIENKDLCVRVYDHGQGFDLEAVPNPDFADLSERGRGIFFIRSLMDSVEYRKTESGNVLEMRKKLA